jgi:DNA-binding CsgD family transcriptional regulator
VPAEGKVPIRPESLVHVGHRANSLSPRQREVLALVAEVRATSHQHGRGITLRRRP